jgi:hypothetical protein
VSEVLALGLVIGVGFFVILARLSVVERKLARLSRLDAKLDALLQASDVTFDAMRDVPPGVREALDQGETILAVKRFREATGAGLKEAKDFVDEVRRRQAQAI